ncbi:MAG TPA: phospholipid carrier-dependent glycosyltransferase [Nitrososphaeraceae archaeon]|nr:phospholipid carrier-dependent glycosyltransferase [Nitrososphaeraceae archaeon]
MRNISASSAILLVIPIALSAFVHTWNPVGFPGIHGDEGHYIRRGIHTSDGLGPQEPTSNYDHPYFGWLSLAAIFSIIGYPDSLYAEAGDTNSIERIWSFPRLIVGLLAIVDTFLIYKITERKYNNKVAFIAAVLFAVMPLSWMMRRVLLESILMPLILCSVLFALYIKPIPTRFIHKENPIQQQLLHRNQHQPPLLSALLSGIFLGLAIFTKIPAITFIPLVGYLVYSSSKRSFKSLAGFIVPVLLIPLLWPTYSIIVNEYDKWLDGIEFQTTRASKPLLDSIISIFDIDPVITILGIGGTIYAVVLKKDILYLLWILPFLLFLYFIDYVSPFFLILLLAPFCIASAALIEDLIKRFVQKRKRLARIVPLVVVVVIGSFGLASTTPLILQNDNSDYFQVISTVSQQLPGLANAGDSTSSFGANVDDDKMTIIGSPGYYWILQYVFDKPDYNYKTQFNLISKNTVENIVEQSEKVILIADRNIVDIVNNETAPDSPKAEQRAERLRQIYESTELLETVGKTQIRTNY